MAFKYKDFTSDHAMALLAMREDIGRGDASQVSIDCNVVMLYQSDDGMFCACSDSVR